MILIHTYIDSILSKNNIINYDVKKEVNIQSFFKEINFSSTFKELANLYNLSLRDINTIYASFLVFEKLELNETKNLKLYQLYLFLMIMKYKDSRCFDKIFIQKDEMYGETFIKQISKLDRTEYDYTSILNFINKDYMIASIDAGEGYKIRSIDICNQKIKYSKNDGFSTYEETLKKNERYNTILSYNDLIKWEQIKTLHIKDFIHRKLEMFDFSWKSEVKENQKEESL